MQMINEEHINDSVLDNLFMVYCSKIDNKVNFQPDIKEKQEALYKIEEKLLQNLNQEDKKDFEEFLIKLNDINFNINKGFFKEGIIQGAKLKKELSDN